MPNSERTTPHRERHRVYLSHHYKKQNKDEGIRDFLLRKRFFLCLEREEAQKFSACGGHLPPAAPAAGHSTATGHPPLNTHTCRLQGGRAGPGNWWGRQAPTRGPEESIALLWCTRASRRDGRHTSCSWFDRAAAALTPQPFLRPPETHSFPESRRCLGSRSRRLEYLSVRGWSLRSVQSWRVCGWQTVLSRGRAVVDRVGLQPALLSLSAPDRHSAG